MNWSTLIVGQVRFGTSRVGVAALVALSLVVSSCTDTSTSTTTTTEIVVTTAESQATTTTEDPQLRLALPIHPDVVHGELDNGLDYYILENEAPGGRAELRLLVDAGSVQEDPDQAGMAHFLEHMMFNGTTRFPRNELITALEAFGPRFGPDINAHTTSDETVYELSLTTDQPGLVALGFQVLREWATEATLTETDVVEERGVVLDEWRLRAQGFDARINDVLEDMLLEDSIYEGHDPIGTDESIQSTSPAKLQRFYDDWYNPDRMAVVAVGDFSASEIQEMIEEEFGDMAAASDPRSWDSVEFQPPSEASAVTYVDEEATFAGITALWPVSVGPVETIGEYQNAIATGLGLEILADRLNDDATLAGSALLGAAALDLAWTRSVGVRGIDVTIRGSRGDRALEHVLAEVERIRRSGITADELERSLAGYRALSTQIYEQQESAQDIEFATQIAAHHLSGSHLMSPAQRFEIEEGILDRLTRDDIDGALARFIDRPPAVLVVGPDNDLATLPDESTVLAAIDEMAGLTLLERVDPGDVVTVLMERPDPADVQSSQVDPRFEFTTLEFANGATVYLWESDIARESVFALVEGFGGTSQIAVEDLTEAFLMTDISGRSGLAGFDVPALRRLLADRLVGLEPWISETRQGLEGNASIDDVETLFQLLHLTMTNPRFDDVAVEAVLDEMRTLDASRADVPEILFEEALNDAYYGEDPRYFVIPPAAEIERFDVAVADRLFTERFGNPANFAFAFVGDFETDAMIDLAARYIGTLPSVGEASGFVDHQPLPPREVQLLTVEAGEGEQGQVGLFFTNEFVPMLEDRLTARLLELILTSRLRERVREELGSTYSIFAGVDLQRDPDPFSESFIISTGDPAELETISTEIVADIDSLQRGGPTPAQFATAIEQLRDELELLDNQILAQGLVNAHLYPDEPVIQLAERYPLVDELTPEGVRQLASSVFDLNQRIEVRQIPRS